MLKEMPYFLHDVMFKIVFGSKGSELPLRALLNALLDLRGPDRIASVRIINPGLDKAHLEERGALLDVRARDEQRRQYNIELQVRRDPVFFDRSVYYTSRHHGGQLMKKQNFDRLAPTVFVGLLDYNAFPGDPALHKSFSLLCKESGEPLTEKLTLHYFQLRRLGKAPPTNIATPAEAWLSLLKFGHLYVPGVVPLPVEIMREEGVAMAIDRLKKARSSEEARAWAESRDKAERTHLTAVSQARKEGLKKGRGEGQRSEKVNTARRLIARGCDDTFIAETTGLTPAEIVALRKH